MTPFHFRGKNAFSRVLFNPLSNFSGSCPVLPDTTKRESIKNSAQSHALVSTACTPKKTMLSSPHEDITSLEQRLARAIELQRQAALQEQLIRDQIRRSGYVEPDSLLVLSDDVLRRTMSYLQPGEVAKSEVCRRLYAANTSVWDSLLQRKYSAACRSSVESAKSSKEKILIHLRFGGRKPHSRHFGGRSIKIAGSPFATIPSMSGMNRSSSPSYSTTYNYMFPAQ